MRRVLPFVLLAGCRVTSHVEEFKPEVVAVRPDGVEVEIRTKPGLRVGIGVTLREGEGTVVPASGKVRVKMPRADWKHYDGNRIQLVGERKVFVKEEYAHGDAIVGPALRDLDRIPTDQDPWFAIVGGGGTYAQGTLGVAVADAPKLRSYPDKKGAYAFVVATPGDATLEIAGQESEVERVGLTTVAVPLRAVLLAVEAESFGKAPRAQVPVVVRRGDDTTKTTMSLVLDESPFDAALRKELVAIEEGQLPGKGATKALTLFVPYDSPVRAIGAKGTVAEARFVAVEHETVRKASSCLYTSFSLSRAFEDVEVRLYDARTGKQVASKKFIAPYVECPEFASNKDQLVWRPKLETTMEWAEKQAAGK